MPRPCASSLLLVEDAAPIRNGLEELFGRQGFRITTAVDGPEALVRTLFRSHK